MRKLLLILGLSLGLVGCMRAMPDGDGIVSYTWNDPVVLQVGEDKLIGQMTTLLGSAHTKGPSYYRQTQQFEASDGMLTCETPLNEKWGGGREGIFAGKSYTTNVNCDDGSSGKMRISVDTWKGSGLGNHGFSGLGTGKLSNGKQLRLVFGPSINVTNTNF